MRLNGNNILFNRLPSDIDNNSTMSGIEGIDVHAKFQIL